MDGWNVRPPRLTAAPLATMTAAFSLLMVAPASAQQADTPTATIAGPNRPPVVTDDSAAAHDGAPVVIRLFANDADPDGDALDLVGGTSAGHGTVSFDGGVATYTPDAGFQGEDSFVYIVSDPHGATSTGTVRIAVTTSAAAAPVAGAPAPATRFPTRTTTPVEAAAPRVVAPPAAQAPAPARQAAVRPVAAAVTAPQTLPRTAPRMGPSTTPYVAPANVGRPATLPFTGPRDAALPLGLGLLLAGGALTLTGRRRPA
jgi:hypothetical protein